MNVARIQKPKPSIEVRKSVIHGRGVFATQRVPKGTLIGTYEGPSTSRNGRYVLWVHEHDGTVTGIVGSNDLRFLNHSLKPNAVFWGAELFALGQIEPETELTIDYGEEWAHVGPAVEKKPARVARVARTQRERSVGHAPRAASEAKPSR